MKYIKIQILEHRDNQAFDDLQQAAAELAELEALSFTARRAADEIAALAQQSQQPVDIDLAAVEVAKAQVLASSLIIARMKIKNASEAHRIKAFQHPKVGTFGYQEINSETMEVVRLLDETGQPFQPDAVFGYKIANTEPQMPNWGIPDAPSA